MDWVHLAGSRVEPAVVTLLTEDGRQGGARVRERPRRPVARVGGPRSLLALHGQHEGMEGGDEVGLTAAPRWHRRGAGQATQSTEEEEEEAGDQSGRWRLHLEHNPTIREGESTSE